MSIKRGGLVLGAIILAFVYMITRIFLLTTRSDASVLSAAKGQREKTLTIASNRGIFVDRNDQPITDAENIIVAVIDPLVLKETEKVAELLSEMDRETFYKKIKTGSPFIAELTQHLDIIGVNTYATTKRYTEPFISPHTIGYLGQNGKGYTGLELSFNEILENQNPIYAVFPVDAVRRAISGLGMEIRGKENPSKSVVKLTIEKELASICEDVADSYIKNGAIVVLDVKSAEILALTSRPSISPIEPQKSINIETAYINKAFYPYNVGSAFKICDTVVHLENGGDVNEKHLCTGNIQVNTANISCQNKAGHGYINLEKAFMDSCNPYFIQLTRGKQKQLLEKAKMFGFGTSTNIANEFSTKEGALPTEKTLLSSIALANFSIGQGDLMATPLQVASMIQAIANNGEYITPTLVKSVNNVKYQNSIETRRVTSQSVAQKVQALMVNTVESGTAKSGKPKYIMAGAKTSTAQTGIKINEKVINQGWFVGFFPADSPKYAVAILIEDAQSGARNGGPAFKMIADTLYKADNIVLN